MSVKPFHELASDTKEKVQEPIKPFVDEAFGGTEIQETSEQESSHTKQKGFFLKTIHFLGSFAGVASVIAVFIFVAIVVDTVQILETLATSGSFLDGLYLLSLAALLLSLIITSYRNYIQIKSLKNVKKMQELFAKQKIDPTKEIVPATFSLLQRYIASDDEKLQQKAQLLQTKIESSHEYKEIYKELDEDLLQEIDKQAQAKIQTASIQAAISTAISPLAVVDAGIIAWRSLRLTKEIAQLYGYKPSWIYTIILLKKGAFHIFFAGVTELAIEYTNDLTERSLISKISTSAAQGLSNGVLLARLGFGIMQACRPLPIQIKRERFVKGIYRSIKERIFASKKQ